MPIAGQRVRVPGSAYTVFTWNDQSSNSGPEQVIAFAQSVAVTSIQPVADAQAIQPLNAKSPIEIVTPGASTYGTLTLTMTELYNQSVWQRLSSLTDCQDIVDIMQTIAAMGNGITVRRVIIPPAGIGNGQYAESYYNCVITQVDDGETIDITTMSVNKTMTIWFTNSSKSWINGGKRKFPLTVINTA